MCQTFDYYTIVFGKWHLALWYTNETILAIPVCIVKYIIDEYIVLFLFRFPNEKMSDSHCFFPGIFPAPGIGLCPKNIYAGFFGTNEIWI